MRVFWGVVYTHTLVVVHLHCTFFVWPAASLFLWTQRPHSTIRCMSSSVCVSTQFFTRSGILSWGRDSLSFTECAYCTPFFMIKSSSWMQILQPLVLLESWFTLKEEFCTERGSKVEATLSSSWTPCNSSAGDPPGFLPWKTDSLLRLHTCFTNCEKEKKERERVEIFICKPRRERRVVKWDRLLFEHRLAPVCVSESTWNTHIIEDRSELAKKNENSMTMMMMIIGWGKIGRIFTPDLPSLLLTFCCHPCLSKSSFAHTTHTSQTSVNRQQQWLWRSMIIIIMIAAYRFICLTCKRRDLTSSCSCSSEWVKR